VIAAYPSAQAGGLSLKIFSDWISDLGFVTCFQYFAFLGAPRKRLNTLIAAPTRKQSRTEHEYSEPPDCAWMTAVLRKNLIGITPPFFQAGIHDAIRREQASFLARNPLGSCESLAVSLAALLEDREFPAQGSDAAALGCSGSSILWRTAAGVARSVDEPVQTFPPQTADQPFAVGVRSEPLLESSTLERPSFPRPGPVPPQRFQTGHESTIDTSDRLESLPSVAATSTMRWGVESH
jgi:hypothetical protein